MNTVSNDATTMKIKFRDKEHFYKVVYWLNTNVGRGKDNWTIHGKVLKFLTVKRKPVTRNVLIYNKAIDVEETQLYLTLI